MMFRRRRFPMRRRRFFKRGFRPFAARVRPKYDKIVLFNTFNGDDTNGAIVNAEDGGSLIVPCGPATTAQCLQSQGDCQPCGTPPCEDSVVCCRKLMTLRLFNNSILESYFQDRVTVVSLYGDLYIRDLVQLGVDSQLCLSDNSVPSLGQYYARYAQQISVAIRKFNSTMAQVQSNPQDFATPTNSYDWSEARWLWQRHRFWAPRPTREVDHTVPGSIMGCCPDVSGGAINIVPPIASGSQPTYDIDTRVSTSCTPCVPNSEGACPDQRNKLQIQEPPWQHFRVRIKRHISMRGDDNLDLQIGLRHPVMYSNASLTGWGCDSSLFPNEQSNWYVHCRIGAVVRLN